VAEIAAEALLSTLKPALSLVGKSLHARLTDRGCTPYVKTIYIGYDFEGVMVAALYPHVDRIEIALALSDAHESELLIDATHLTWRTLPVAAVVKSEADGEAALDLIDEACERIQEGQHDVERPNDYFMKARRDSDLGAHRPSR